MSFDAPTFADRRYQVEELIGWGATGAVFRAVDRLRDEPVAIKHLAATADKPAFAREFKTLASLRHPHVVRVLDYGFDILERPYLVMEYLAGAQPLIEAGRERPPSEQVDLILQLLEALTYLHRRNVLHCDLKPANVLVVEGQVQVVDFGLAILTRDAQRRGTEISGTFAYMAPEIVAGEPPSTLADLYSAGLMAAEMLIGRHPFQIERFATMLDEIRNKIPDLRAHGVDDRLAAALERSLAKKPDARYADAPEMMGALCEATDRPRPPARVAVQESFLRAAQFVGREEELARFDHLLAETLAGRGGAWLIAGESGVGKSRLFAEMRTRALIAGANVSRGFAVRSAGRPFHLWQRPLRRLLLVTEPDDLEAGVVQAVAGDVEALLGRVVPEPPELPFEAAKKRFREVVEALYGRLRRPTVVMVEDLQWCDDESLELFERLVLRARELPLLLIGNYRDDEQPWTAARMPLTATRLERLPADHIGDLCASMLGAVGRDPRILALVQRETEGNAFFVVEVIRALAEDAGDLDAIGTAPLPERCFPGGIQEIVERRLQRLPKVGREALQLAAVLGRRPNLRTLRKLVGPRFDLDRWLTICADAAVFEAQEDHWIFAHDKLREGVLDALDAESLRSLHERVAEAILEEPESPERTATLAHHFRQSGNLRQTAHWNLRAGDDASRISAYTEARGHYQVALDALEHFEEDIEVHRNKVDALLALTNTTFFSDPPEKNIERLREVERLLGALTGESFETSETPAEDRRRWALMYHASGRCHYVSGRQGEAIDDWKQVLLLGRGDAELQALPASMIGRALAVQGRYGKAKPLLEQALGPLEKTGMLRDWTGALAIYGVSLACQGDYAAGIAQVRRALAASRETESAISTIGVQVTLCFGLYHGRELVEMRDLALDTIALCEVSGDRVYAFLATGLAAWAAGRLGDLDMARDMAMRWREIRRELGDRVLLQEVQMAARAEAGALAGRFDEAEELAKEALEGGRAIDSPFAIGIAQRALGIVADAGARPEVADIWMRDAVDTFQNSGSLIEAARSRLTWSRLLAAQGRDVEARQLSETAGSWLRDAGLSAVE